MDFKFTTPTSSEEKKEEKIEIVENEEKIKEIFKVI